MADRDPAGDGAGRDGQDASIRDIEARVAENRWFWLMLLRTGPRRDQDEATSDRIQREHLAHLFELEAAGQLTLFGPVEDAGDLRGLGVLTVATREEAEALMVDDPAVRAGRLAVEIRPWFTRPGAGLPADDAGAARPGVAGAAPAAVPGAPPVSDRPGPPHAAEPGSPHASDRPSEGLAMYDELAGWFHLLTAPSEYADEAARILELLREAVDGPLETLLELGAGGGNTASHLGAHLRLTLTDISPAMLDLSRQVNPAAEHLTGDMRTLRLGRTFDAVLIHDAVMYLTSEDDLRAAMETAWVHLRPGGALLIATDHVRETFEPSTSHGGHDGKDRALRYLEWTYDPDPDDTVTVTDFAMLLREGRDDVRVRFDRHLIGMFGRQIWLDLLAEVGFEARSVRDEWARDIFVGVRPAAA